MRGTFSLGRVQFRCKACVLWNTVIVLVTSAHEQKSGKQGDYYSDQTMTSSHKNGANSQETTRPKGRKEGRLEEKAKQPEGLLPVVGYNRHVEFTPGNLISG